MTYPHEKAVVHILDWRHKVERALIDRTVVLFSGETGIVKDVRLDDHHALCFTLDKHGGEKLPRRWFPVSVIKTIPPDIRKDMT